MERCGQCQHFTRARQHQKDLCGAWEQPTLATRAACGFFLPRRLPELPKTDQAN
ncbi:hypothetical protein [Aeromonas simiae]|uniref:hypothetical protein n=1 Tax=Aeromonas simiae TaxID=218936 RepID=UPI0038D1E5E8